MINPGSIGVIVVSLIALVAFWQGDRLAQRARGAQTERHQIEIRSTANAQKATIARRSAEKLPPDALKDGYFRD